MSAAAEAESETRPQWCCDGHRFARSLISLSANRLESASVRCESLQDLKTLYHALWLLEFIFDLILYWSMISKRLLQLLLNLFVIAYITVRRVVCQCKISCSKMKVDCILMMSMNTESAATTSAANHPRVFWLSKWCTECRCEWILTRLLANQHKPQW